jgi:glycosyltransferase involved in cell wall biosynthesis
VRVSVIIPTRNEALAIGRVLADVPKNLVNEVIVIDNCSSDGTPEIAARMGARVISETRCGYGRACLTGYLFGLRISDLGPFRAARAEALRAVELEETTYGWAVELIVKGAIRGLRIIEVPVSYHPRIGKSKISGTLRGTIGAAWFILSLITRYYFQRREIARQPA